MDRELLIVFTYRYPYNPPIEQFLDMELPYLKSDNRDILLVPLSRTINSELAYDIVQKREVSIRILKRKTKLVETLTAIGRLPFFWGDLADNLKEAMKVLPASVRRNAIKLTLQQYAQAYSAFEAMKQQLPEISEQKYNRIVLYTYWLDATALSICFLKDYIQKDIGTEVVAIARAHGQGDLYQGKLEFYRPAHQLMQNKLDQIFPISVDGCTHLKKQGISNTTLARLGVPSALVDTTNNALSAQRAESLIISCSTVNENKRVAKIAEIIAGIQDRPMRWIHFGGGALEKEVIQWCEKNMPLNIQWKINGTTAHEDIMQYYEKNSPDLFINVSRVEGVPVSIMEAFSYAIPCFATRAGATAEIVEDEMNGYLFPIDFDNSQASATISRYLGMDYQDRKKMRDAAFVTWKTKCNSDENYRNFAISVKRAHMTRNSE